MGKGWGGAGLLGLIMISINMMIFFFFFFLLFLKKAGRVAWDQHQQAPLPTTTCVRCPATHTSSGTHLDRRALSQHEKTAHDKPQTDPSTPRAP